MRPLARGQPMKEVAAHLGITARTVAFHKYGSAARRGETADYTIKFGVSGAAK